MSSLRTVSASAVSGLVLLVIGCSNAAAPVAPLPAEPAVPATLEFGQTFNFADGLSLTVQAPVIYRCGERDTANQYCQETGEEGNPRLLVTFDFVNKGTEIIRNGDTGSLLPRFAGLNASTLVDFDPAPITTTFGDQFSTVISEAPLTPGESATEESLFDVSDDASGTVPVEVTWDGGNTGFAVFSGNVDLGQAPPVKTPSSDPAPDSESIDPAPAPSGEGVDYGSCPAGDPACGEGDLTDEELEQYGVPSEGEQSSGESQFEYGCQMGYITEGC